MKSSLYLLEEGNKYMSEEQIKIYQKNFNAILRPSLEKMKLIR